MSRSRKSLAGVVVLQVLALSWAGCGKPAPPETLRIATGTEGGTYFTVGRRLARLLEEYSGAEIGEVESTKSLGTLAENGGRGVRIDHAAEGGGALEGRDTPPAGRMACPGNAGVQR